METQKKTPIEWKDELIKSFIEMEKKNLESPVYSENDKKWIQYKINTLEILLNAKFV